MGRKLDELRGGRTLQKLSSELLSATSLPMLAAKTTSQQLQVSRDSQRKRAHTSLGKLVLKEYTLDTSLH